MALASLPNGSVRAWVVAIVATGARSALIAFPPFRFVRDRQRAVLSSLNNNHRHLIIRCQMVLTSDSFYASQFCTAGTGVERDLTIVCDDGFFGHLFIESA